MGASPVAKFRKESYNTLVDTYGPDQYDITEKEFNDRMDSDPAFADETFINLREAYNGKPPYSDKDFKKKVGAKVISPTSAGGSKPSPAQGGGQTPSPVAPTATEQPQETKTAPKTANAIARYIGRTTPGVIQNEASRNALRAQLEKKGYSAMELDQMERNAQIGVKQRQAADEKKKQAEQQQQQNRQSQALKTDTTPTVRDETTQTVVQLPVEGKNVVSAERKKLQEDAFNLAYDVFEKNAIKLKPEADPANKGKFVYVKDEETGGYKKVTYDERYTLAPSDDPNYGKQIDNKKLDFIVEQVGKKYNLAPTEKTHLRQSLVSTWESKPSSKKAQIVTDMQFAQRYGATPGLMAMDRQKKEQEMINLKDQIESNLTAEVDVYQQEAKTEVDQLTGEFEGTVGIMQNRYAELVNTGQLSPGQADLMFKNDYAALVRGVNERQQGIQTRYARKANAAKLQAENYFADQLGKSMVGMTEEQKKFYSETYRENFKASEADRSKALENLFRQKGYGEQIVTAFNAGVVDLYSSIGGFLGYAGFQDANYKMEKGAETVYRGLGPMVSNMDGIFDASWWISNGVRSAPMMMALAPVGMYGGAISGQLARLVTSSQKYQRLSGLIGGGLAAHRAETFLEQGGAFNDAIAQGKSVEEASQIAAEVGTYNLATLPLQMVQMLPMFKYFDDAMAGALGVVSGSAEEVWQGYSQAKALANQEGRDYTFTEYLQTEEAAVSAVLGAAFEATPFILHGQLSNLSEKANLNTQIGTIQNMIESGSYIDAAAAVEAAYLNSAIDEKTKNTFNTIINASAKVVEQTSNIDNEVLRQAAHNSLVEAEYYRQQAKASRGTVAEALTQKAMMAEQDAAQIISGDAPVMAVIRKGDKAPTIMTDEMMKKFLQYDNIVEGAMNGEINIVIRNNPEMEQLLKDRIWWVNTKINVVPIEDAMRSGDYNSKVLDKINDNEYYNFSIPESEMTDDLQQYTDNEFDNKGKISTLPKGISGDIARLKEKITGKESSKRQNRVMLNIPGDALRSFVESKRQGQQAPTTTEQAPTTTQQAPKPAGETVSFRTSVNEPAKQGTKVTIPGFEDVDFVMTQDGMSYRIHELSTGMEVDTTEAFTPEEAVSQISTSLSNRFKGSDDFLTKLQRKIDEGKYSQGVAELNKSEALEKFKAKQQGEYEALPFVHSEQERNDLLQVAQEAKSKGLDSAATMIENAANAKQGKYFGQKMPIEKAKEILASAEGKENLKKAQKEGKPYEGPDKESFVKGEVALRTVVNYGMSTDRYGSLPRNIREKALKAFDQLSDIKNKYGYLPEAIKSKLDSTPDILAGQIAMVPTKRSLSESEKKAETKRLTEELDMLAKTVDAIHKQEIGEAGQAGEDIPNQIIDDETRAILEEAGTQYTYMPQNDEEVAAALANGDRVFGVNEIDGEVEEIFSLKNARKNLGELRVLPKEVEATIKEGKSKAYDPTPAEQYGVSQYIKFAFGVKQKVTYKVIESDQLIPSHVESGVRNPAHTIASSQPKERGDVGSKIARETISVEPNFKLLGMWETAFDGAPVVNERNEVIQGNNRSLGLKRHYDIVKGETYKQDLIDNAESLGIDPEVIKGMDKPILVREAAVNDMRAIELGQYDVKDLESGGKQRIDATTISRKISSQDKRILSGLIFGGEYESVAEAVRSNVSKLKEIFKKYINLAQFQTAFDDQGITRSGSEDLQAVMNQFMFEGGEANLPTLFDTLPATIKTGLQKSLNSIFDTPNQKSPLPATQKAISMLAEFYASGQSDFKAWSKTIDMFTQKTPIESYGPEASAIAKSLEKAAKQKEIAELYAKYAQEVNAQEANLIEGAKEGKSMDEAMQTVFGMEAKKEAPKQDQPITTPKPPSAPPSKGPSKPMSEEEKRVRDAIKKAGKDIFGGGELYTGLDPEKLAKVAGFVGEYIKLGYIKFKDVLDIFFNDFGKNIKNFITGIKEAYLLYWNSAPEDIADKMDDPATVKKFKYEEPTDVTETGPIEVPTETAEQEFKKQFRQAVKEAIDNDPKMNIIRLRSLAKEIGYDATDTQLQEQVEAAIYELGREVVVASKGDNQAALKELIRIYENQPTISMRSSERVEKGQFSTPIPYAFLADMFISDSAKNILEPSAGNGFLTVKFDPKNVTVNEIDAERLSNLQETPYKDVLSQDALSTFDTPMMDGIVMNPPFGGLPAPIEVEGYKLRKLDHAMTANALQKLAPNGTAAIIIGGHNQFDENGVMSNEADRVFFNYLFAKFNVAGVLNIAGDMFSKQGTTFPTRLILINGRRPEGAKALLPNKNNPLTPDLDNKINNWAELYNVIQNKKIQNEEANLQSDLDAQLPNNEDVISGVGTGTNKQGSASSTGAKPDQTADTGSRGGQARGTRTDTGRVGERPTSKQGVDTGRDGGGDNGVGGFSDTTVDFPNEPTGDAGADVRRGKPTRDLRSGDASRLPSKLTADDLKKEKAPYIPVSKLPAVGSIIPTTMALDVEQALLKLEQRVGPLDDYVMDQLDYNSIDELKSAFSAEQVDAIALAVDQIKQGGGFIVGDMTGIGKGRIAAGIIRYSMKNGLMPIFFTEAANLFSDLYRDLVDIGSGKIAPFIVNNESTDRDPNIYDMSDENPNKKPVYRSQGKAVKEKEYKLGSVSKGYNVILATYSQYQNPIKSQFDKDKFEWIRNSAKGAVLILDEAHNAAGKGNRYKFISGLVASSRGVTYLSATFAKNPTSMPVYASKTAMRDTGMESEDLIEAIKRGGVALQEIISSGLVKAGQMIRRERDFTGVKISYDVIAELGSDADNKIRERADKFTDIMRNMIDFQRTHVKPAMKAFLEDPTNEEIQKIKTRTGTKDMGIKNVPFSSKVFNVINQMLLATKAEATADMAIEELKKGNKPVISLMNTMESFLTDMVAQETEAGIFETAPIKNPDLSLVLMRGINSMFKVTVSNAEGKTFKYNLPEEYLTQEGKKQLAYLRSLIRNASSGLSLSPIDTIKERIAAAGYKIGEITGRDRYLEFQPDGSAIVQKRSGKENKDKRTLVAKFNSGELDALIFNATSGISLHASPKFKDKRPRVMITPQLRLNVSDEAQARGRIDRTGQVHRGSFRYVVSTIPAETRLLLMFQSKMDSLNANTTTSQKNKVSDTGYSDFLNKYGDKIVYEYLLENPTLVSNMMLDGVSDTIDGLARQITGQVAILSTKDQDKFYKDVTERYKDHIDFLTQSNQNDLEVKTLQFDATILEQETAIVGKGTNSPFGTDTYFEFSEVNVLKKPLKLEEVNKAISKSTEGLTPEEYKATQIQLISDNYDEFIDSKSEELYASWKQRIENRREKLINEGKSQDEIDKDIADYQERAELAIATEMNRINENKISITSKLRYFTVKKVYMVPVDISGDAVFGISRGVFLGFDINKNPTGILTKGQIKAKFATADGRRTVSIPLSMAPFIDSVISNTTSLFSDTDDTMKLENWDKTIPTKTRELKYIATGNILQAFEKDEFRGQLVRFTDDQGSIRDGILMPAGFKRDFSSDVIVPFNRAMEWARSKNADYQFKLNEEDVTISYYANSKTLTISVPASRKEGGKFYLDNDLRALVVKNNFTQRGIKFKADVPAENVDKFIKVLTEKFKASTRILASLYNMPDPNKVDDAKKKYENAKAQVRKLFKGKPGQTLGFAYDPQQAAREMYDKHVALVNLAKAAIGLGVTKFSQFIKDNQLRSEKWVKRAWVDAENQIAGQPPMFATPDDMMDEAINRVVDVLDAQAELGKDQQSKLQKAGKFVRDTFVRDLFGERRFDLQNRLRKEGGYLAYMYLANAAGAGAAAREFISKQTSDIFSGLNKGEEQLLNGIIQARRTIQIEDIYNQRRADELSKRISDYTAQNNNVPPSQREIDAMKSQIAKDMKTPMNPDGTTAAEWEAWLEDKKKSDPELLTKLDERADLFFSAMNDLLLKRLEAKRISVATYDKLSQYDYSRRMFIQHFTQDIDREYILPKGIRGSANKDIYTLDEGSENLLINNSRYLLQVAAISTYITTANNLALMELYKFAKNNGTDWVQPWSNYKSVPNGYTKFVFYDNDVQKSVIMVDEFASMWSPREAMMSPVLSGILQFFTQAPVTRFMATGVGNSFFFLTNLPRDFAQVLFFTNTYNPALPIAVPQFLTDMVALTKDVAMRKGEYLNAVEQGMMMDFMGQQGNPFFSGSKIQLNAVEKAWDTFSGVLGYLNNTFELLPRMAIRRRTIMNLTAKFIQDNGRTPLPDELMAIETEATFYARDYMDFATGPRLIKELDKAVPYLNAMTIGVKNAVVYTAQNPGKFGIKAAQGVAFAAALFAYALKNYEDEMEDDINNDIKNRYHVIPLPYQRIDEQGQVVRDYVSIPKNQSMAVHYALAEELTRYQMTGKFDSQRIIDAAEYSGLTPGDVNWYASIPSFAFYLAAFQNKEIVIGTGESREIYKTYSAQSEETKYDPDKTRKLFVDLGAMWGMSPQQLQVGIGKIVTDVNTNVWTSALLTGYDAVTGQMTQQEKLGFGGALYEGMKKSLGAPLNRVIKTTRPGINDQTMDKAYDVLKQQGDLKWEEKNKVKQNISEIMSGEKQGITITNTAEMQRYKRAALNMKIDAEMKMIRQMGVDNGFRGAYIAERMFELSNGSTADPEKLKEFQNQLIVSGLITDKVAAYMGYYGTILKIESDVKKMQEEGMSEDEIKRKLNIPTLWPKSQEYRYERNR